MKKWLTNNEIYFKALAYVLIPVMAVFLSIQANIIANKQAQILEEQAQILEEQAQIFRQQQLPVITMQTELVYDEKIGKYTDDILRIFNEGDSLRNFKVYAATFFLIEYSKETEPLQKALIPVTDYYFATIHTGQSTGLLATLFIEQNNLMFSEIEKSFRKYASDNNAYGFLSVHRYLEITYTDIFGEHHSEIHYVDPIFGGSKLHSGIRRLAALQAMKLHHESPLIGLSIELANAMPETLIQKLRDFQSIKKQNYPILHFLW